MPAPLLLLTDIALTFGGTPLLTDAGLSLAAGQRIALVGRNGSGKSTLLKIASGEVEADRGTRFVQPGTTVRYLPQEPDLSGFSSTIDYVQAGLGPGDDPHRARYLLEHLGLNGTERPGEISGGEARRAALARVLAPSPDVILLDEPTNHLDLVAIEWLEAELAGLRSAMVIISHDRRFLANLTGATLWLDQGISRRLDQGFARFEAWRDKWLEEEEVARHKLDRQIVREEHWLRYGVTARRKRNMGRLGRLADLRQARRDRTAPTGNVDMSAASARRSGAIVIDAKEIAKSWGDRAIVRPFSLRVLRGDRVGIVGPNGAGKTTLVNLLTGKLPPDSGNIGMGAGVELAFLDQRRASLDPSMPLAEALSGGSGETVTINGRSRHIVSYMKEYLFTPEQAGTAVGRLSGGERARVTLARALSLPSNLLVLDEPTNDLDLETLDLLQELITDYAGTVILVSHDRDFLDRVATSIIAFEGDGRWVEYAGGYSDMLAQRQPPEPALSPVVRKSKNGAPPRPEKGSVPRRKLSYKQQFALKNLPAAMQKLELQIDRTGEKLADPALYASDPGQFATLSDALARYQAELAAAEEEWLELEMLREQLKG
ncbi:MAG: ABC-F family ATP-binding cassette domain-containing protein [Alphaproteobacteria bacterium]|nr:ABC-F family ATP-binding cassette domain-containing protein [Alphaproteobacteria bacterium]